MTSQIERLQNELHELEKRMETLRRRIWAVENGLETVEDPEGELTRLRAEFDEAGKTFTVTYREWRREHAEE
jgi:predicted  nucleic acid-binding Zn-ribbon protein